MWVHDFIGSCHYFLFLAPPSAPLDVSITSIIQSSFAVLWSKPDITNADALSYIIEYGLVSSFMTNITGFMCDIMCSSTIVDGINPNTTYLVRVYGENEFGIGPPSETINVTTLPINSKFKIWFSLSHLFLSFRWAGFFISGCREFTAIIQIEQC